MPCRRTTDAVVAELIHRLPLPADRQRSPYDTRPTGRFGVIVVGAAFVLALATFLVFAGFTPIIPTAPVVLTLLLGDGLVVVILIILISMELARLRAARRAARAGARLHSRFVVLFSLVAAIPAIVTAVVATVSVEWAINPRFMSDVAAFINEDPPDLVRNVRILPADELRSILDDCHAAAETTVSLSQFEADIATPEHD